jgi:cell division protein FtsW
VIENLFNKVFRINGDRVIWGVIFLLFLISVMVVYSATGTLAYLQRGGNTAFFLIKQLVLITGCFGLILIFKSIPYKYYSVFSGLVLLASVFLLFIVQFAGTEVNNSARWIAIPGIGLTFQPSELAKIGLIMYTSRVLSLNQKEDYCDDIAFKHILIVGGFILFLIFLDDFSTAFLLGSVVFFLLFIGRVRLKLLGILMGSLIGLLVAIVIVAPYLPHVGRLGSIHNRVKNYISDNEDNKSDETYNYQIEQSKIAIATGGILGKGPGNSVQRNFLPLPYSDFIYAIIIEEGGWIYGFGILILYLFIIYRAGIIVRKSTKVFPALLTFGLAMSMVFQAMMNMCVALGIIPITGQPLPLVSMGGSSLIFTSIALGMILSVSCSIQEEEKMMLENTEEAEQ